MAFIYSLETDGLIWYVGSTTDFERRKGEHMRKPRQSHSSTAVKYIPSEYVWEMKLLETCNESERMIRECHYYDTLSPLYGRRAIVDKTKKYMNKLIHMKERHNQIKDIHNKKCREYYRNNRNILLEKARNKYHAKKTIDAESAL